MEIKLSKEVKRYLERELKDYKSNKAFLEEQRLDIIDSSPKITLGVPSSKNANEGQTAKVYELMTNKTILRLEKMCKKIEKVLESLNGDQYELYVRHFEKGHSKTKVCLDMHIGEATFHRYKNKIINKLAEEIGHI